MPDSEAAPSARRGRIWVILFLGLALFALGVAVVGLATREAAPDSVRDVAGVSDAQRLFGGLPQSGDRLGSADAPVTIQVFNDVQCSSCRAEFLATIPDLVEDEVRAGEVKLLMRHYSVARNPLEVGFFGAEAAAQQGYGWQFIYLFFRNQGQAERLGVDEEFMSSLAGSIEHLEVGQWEKAYEREIESEGPFAATLEGYNELGTELGIRTGQAMIATGPNGTRTLQDGPSLAEIETAIAAVQ